MFCNNDVDVFNLKVYEENNMTICMKLSYYQLYIYELVDIILNDMFNFPNTAYITNNIIHSPDVHFSARFFICENRLIVSVIECHLDDISTSRIKYINTAWNTWLGSIVSNKKYHNRYNKNEISWRSQRDHIRKRHTLDSTKLIRI